MYVLGTCVCVHVRMLFTTLHALWTIQPTICNGYAAHELCPWKALNRKHALTYRRTHTHTHTHTHTQGALCMDTILQLVCLYVKVY